jgi:hypothetical protein
MVSTAIDRILSQETEIIKIVWSHAVRTLLKSTNTRTARTAGEAVITAPIKIVWSHAIRTLLKSTNIRTARTGGEVAIAAPIATHEKLVSIVAVITATTQIVKPMHITMMDSAVLLALETDVVRPLPAKSVLIKVEKADLIRRGEVMRWTRLDLRSRGNETFRAYGH